MKILKIIAIAISIILATSSANAQAFLNANGPGGTYELFNNALAPGYDVVEHPECAHPAFGRHIAEVWDTDLGKYVFEFYMHVAEDNDRCINFDRQRVEIKTYDQSPNSLIGIRGETIMYKWEFKIPVGFKPSSNFTHIHQIKAVGGDDGDPIFTLTVRKGSPNKIELIHDNKTRVTIVNLSLFEGVWVECTEVVFVDSVHGRYSMNIKKQSDGSTLLNYTNSDLMTIRSDNTFIRPKWGIYRSLLSSADLRDESLRFNGFYIAENSTTALPGTPTLFSAHASTATQINLAWNDNSTNEESFSIERSTDSSTWILAASIDPNATSYTDIVADSNTMYYYRLCSKNSFGSSPYITVSSKLNSNPLSVEISSLTAATERLSAVLRWTTETETSNAGFDIERKKILSYTSSVFNRDWEWLGFVPGAGTSNSKKEYIYVDRSATPGKYLYRLKQTDTDGVFKFLQFIEVEVGSVPELFTLSNNYPNPFNPTTTVEFTLPSTGRATLKVFSMLGQEISTLVDQELPSGTIHRYQVDAKEYSSGLYFYQLSFGNQRLVKRMTLIK